jgi:hypothetical protein
MLIANEGVCGNCFPIHVASPNTVSMTRRSLQSSPRNPSAEPLWPPMRRHLSAYQVPGSRNPASQYTKVKRSTSQWGHFCSNVPRGLRNKGIKFPALARLVDCFGGHLPCGRRSNHTVDHFVEQTHMSVSISSSTKFSRDIKHNVDIDKHGL